MGSTSSYERKPSQCNHQQCENGRQLCSNEPLWTRERPLDRQHVFYGYYLVAAAFIAQFVSIGVISYILGPFMVPMIEELGWTRAEFTISRSISQIVMGIGGFFIGAYVDRIGARPLMLLGTVVLAVSLAAHAWISELWHWFLLNGLFATLGCALVGNLVVNVTMAKWFVEKRGQVVAWAAMGVSLGGVIITPGAIYLIDSLGWRDAWLVLAEGAWGVSVVDPVPGASVG